MIDAEVRHAIELETERQTHNIELIASENYVSRDVLEAVGSILTNKYAEGYPGRRYYGGCVDVDKIENLARERVVSGGTCQRPAAFRFPGQYGSLYDNPAAR